MADHTSKRCTVLALICWLTTWPAPAAVGETQVAVTTKLGVIIGLEESGRLPNQTEKILRVFRGIPYARPPLGELRFAKPKAAEPFSPYSFGAFHFGPACPQRVPGAVINMSEDCLSLNIYAPKPTAPNPPALPVIVWIHGGAFMSGEGRLLPGENLAAFGEIVVVTLNYRLGALGFLATDDAQARGNFGLWDQRLALQWVSDNIAEFGGDPGNVTLAGTTSGGHCVTHHAISAHSSGLFHRIVAESGTALSVGGYTRKGWNHAQKLGTALGCDLATESKTATLVSCLREKDYRDIIGVDVRPDLPFMLAWTPVVDRDFIATDPKSSLLLSTPVDIFTVSASSPKFSAVDAMFGTTSSDGSVMFDIWVKAMASARKENVTSGVPRGLVEAVVEALVKAADSMDSSTNSEHVQAIKDAVIQEYTDWEDPEKAGSRARQLVDLLTDQGFFVPSVQFARRHAQVSSSSSSSSARAKPRTYMYVFDQPAPWAPSPFPWFRGSRHKDHDLFVLGLPGSVVDASSETGAELFSFSRAVMTYWANFVKTGNPNSPDELPVEWPSFTLDKEAYLYLEEDAIAARSRCRARKVAFWLNYVPKVKATAQAIPCTSASVSSARFDYAHVVCTVILGIMMAVVTLQH